MVFTTTPKNEKQESYISSILTNDEIRAIPQDELILCAYIKRVMSNPKTLVIKLKHLKFYAYLDTPHYNETQKKRWLPDEIWGAGVEAHREVSENDLATFILKHETISDAYRVWYIHKFPEKVRLNGEYHALEVQKKAEDMVKRNEELRKKKLEYLAA